MSGKIIGLICILGTLSAWAGNPDTEWLRESKYWRGRLVVTGILEGEVRYEKNRVGVRHVIDDGGVDACGLVMGFQSGWLGGFC